MADFSSRKHCHKNVESGPSLVLGTYEQESHLRRFRLDTSQLASHKHLIGLTGQGKSKLLESIFLQLLSQGIGVSLIDPHRDLARDILEYLVADGFFDRPEAYGRLMYLDFSLDRYVPFNILKSRLDPPDAAYAFLEALRRAWPTISGGSAPQLENIVLAAATALSEVGLPATHMPRLLSDPAYRADVLQRVTDPEVHQFFEQRFAKGERATSQMSESTLRRIFLLSFAPALRHSLGQAENILDFRRFMDEGTSVIYDLGGVQNPDARRLLGCLISVGYEMAALSRVDARGTRPQHHLILDEFADFVAQSEEAFTRMLAQCRKYGLYLTLAHQTWSQASHDLRSALQNAGLDVVFRLGRGDAEATSHAIGHVDPTLTDPQTGRNISFATQWEAWARDIQNLGRQEAMVKLGNHPALRVRTLGVPNVSENPDGLDQVLSEYARRYQRQVSMISKADEASLPMVREQHSTPAAVRRLWQREATAQ